MLNLSFHGMTALSSLLHLNYSYDSMNSLFICSISHWVFAYKFHIFNQREERNIITHAEFVWKQIMVIARNNLCHKITILYHKWYLRGVYPPLFLL